MDPSASLFSSTGFFCWVEPVLEPNDKWSALTGGGSVFECRFSPVISLGVIGLCLTTTGSPRGCWWCGPLFFSQICHLWLWLADGDGLWLTGLMASYWQLGSLGHRFIDHGAVAKARIDKAVAASESKSHLSYGEKGAPILCLLRKEVGFLAKLHELFSVHTVLSTWGARVTWYQSVSFCRKPCQKWNYRTTVTTLIDKLQAFLRPLTV
ncbi:hypothetical protein RHMOL_Rhmol08G0245000 [Rhododendron molle]|uniref:Uncharacterized protein n=1 Tax=Rhododendron molle TaxID=49168 RepID=A0ACC0MS88_RHOML|nr:hypothetical protein RHMOL_Rhmol08G0245000 [Rhododendron molle]